VLLVVVDAQLAARARAPERGDGAAHGVDGDPVVVLCDAEEHRHRLERAGRHAVEVRRAEQRAGEDRRGAVGLGPPGEVLGEDARALREADQRHLRAGAPGRRHRGLDGLQRPAQPRLVVLERVVEAARVPGALGRARRDVGDGVVESEPACEVEHPLGVEAAPVEEHGGDRSVRVAGRERLGRQVRVRRHGERICS
jgi:hypothetical protein